MPESIDEIERKIVQKIRRRQWKRRIIDVVALCGLTILIIGGVFSAIVIIHLFQ